MSAAFKPGQQVQQVVKPIRGEVKRFAFDTETGNISYIVGWSDAEGDHERSFEAADLEAAPEQTAPPEPSE